jgi:hypothetical protein
MKIDRDRVRFFLGVTIVVIIAELLISAGIIPQGWAWLHWLDWIR